MDPNSIKLDLMGVKWVVGVKLGPDGVKWNLDRVSRILRGVKWVLIG